MKTQLVCLFLILHLSFDLFAQWTVKHLAETSFSWDNKIKFKNDSLGLCMGSNSLILKSIDAGETWKQIPFKIKMNLFDFQVTGDSTVYAIGNFNPGSVEDDYSLLIKSNDNGNTWDSISGFIGKQLWSLFFLDEKTGIVAGYDGIFRTSDSGKSWDTNWTYSDLGYEFGEIKQISFPTNQIGFAVGIGYHHTGMPDNFLLQTIDSGLVWDSIYTFKEDLTGVFFLNADTGFVGTLPGILYKTIDGGHSWTEKKITEYWNIISSIQFISDKIGFVIGHQGIITDGVGGNAFFISKTIDCGETWETFSSPGIPLNSVFFINDSTGFVSGGYSLIMKTKGKIDELPADYPWHLADDGLNVRDIEDANSLVKAFPNPTTGPLNLHFRNTAQQIQSISLLNISGQIIHFKIPEKTGETVQLDLSGLPSGIYILQIRFPERSVFLNVIRK